MESVVNHELFGVDPKVVKSVNVARNVAVSKAPVLIVGEIGVGKKTLGKYIHQHSSRANGPFEVVDCGPDSERAVNEILGYRDQEGKFHRGIIEKANGGTVVFANVDGLDEEFQKKLHKILNELEDYDLDIRIICTTTKNLSKLVGAGRFYRALYTYISSNTLNLSPLRERLHDLEMLAKHFLADAATKQNKAVNFDTDAMNKILSHYWTHNLLELRSVIESSVECAETDLIDEETLSIGDKKTVSLITEEDSEGIRLMSLKEAEKLLIKKALVHTSENRTQAAKILGVSIRTLRNKINEYRNDGAPYFLNLR